MQKHPTLHTVIFRHNLRSEDNEALFAATQAANIMPNSKLIALFSTEILEGNFLGHPKCSPKKREFILGTLKALQESLDLLNIPLIIVSSFEKTIQKLAHNHHIKLYISQEVGVEESLLERSLAKYEHALFFEQTMIEPFAFDYTKSFSHFRKHALKRAILPAVGSATTFTNKLDDFDIETLQIKEEPSQGVSQEQAKNRMEYYFAHHLHSYEQSRFLIDGENISTQLSLFLSLGVVSAKRVYSTLQEAEKIYGSSSSSAFIFMELLWRDFFHLVMQQSHNKLFLKNGFSTQQKSTAHKSEKMQLFFSANTQEPLINAGVKELRLTGWLSNRMRQLLANYFCKVLELDFRYGAAFFQTYLIDYNPAANWGNWAYQAGVGNDKRGNVFDIAAQCARYGGDAYIKKWESFRV